METFSALLAICAGNSPVPGEYRAQRPVTLSFGVFFDLRLNKRLSKQSRGWWFETLSRPLWRHRNGYPVTGRKFCAIPVMNYWTHTKFPYIHNVMIDTLEIVGIVGEVFKKWHIFVILLCNFDFADCKLHFSPKNTTRESCLKVTTLDFGWCQAISNKSQRQIRVFSLHFPDIPYFCR